MHKLNVIGYFKNGIRLLVSHVGFRRYATNAAWLFIDKIFRIFSSVFIGIWVARHLGPSEFGMLSYAQSFVFIFSAFSTLGLDGIVVRELIKKRNEEHLILGSAFCLKLFASIFVVFFSTFISYITANDNTQIFLVFIISCSTIFQSFNVIDFDYQSRVLSKYVAICSIASLFISNLFKVYLILNNGDVIDFSIVYSIEMLLFSFLLTYSYKRQAFQCLYKWRFHFGVARSLLKDSWPLVFTGALVSIYMKIDQVMINYILGEKSVGIYSAAVRISEAWYFFPVIITATAYPAIVKSRVDSFIYFSRIQNLYVLMFWLAFLISIPVSVFSKDIINLLYGSDYNEASKVLSVHMWGSVFVFLGVAFSSFLNSENLAKVALFRTLIGAAVNIILNFLFIPEYGVVGAAVATLVAQAFSNLFYDLFDPNVRRYLYLKINAIFPFLLWRKK